MDPGQLRRIAHDTVVFEAFYREHVEAVQRFVTRRVDDPQLAADLTAEVFLAAVGAACSYRSELGAPGAWLFGVARIVIARELRRSARERDALRRVYGRALLDGDDVVRIQERIDAAAAARSLHAALGRLPESEREVLELVALDELDVAEAATVLGIRAVTARVRLHRARRTLRRQLPPTDETEEIDEDSPSLTRPLEASR